MLIGYDRIGTKDRGLDLQLNALQRAEREAVFTKVASGAKAARPVVDEVLSRLRAGNMLLIWKLDRLGRSLKHLVILATELMEHKVGLISLNDSVDATSPQGRLVFNIFASLAEFERDLIRERTQAGLATARARGRTGGRPRGLSRQAEVTALAAETLYREGRLSTQRICDQPGISKTALCAYLEHRGVKAGSRRNLENTVYTISTGVPSAHEDPYYPMRRVQEDD